MVFPRHSGSFGGLKGLKKNPMEPDKQPYDNGGIPLPDRDAFGQGPRPSVTGYPGSGGSNGSPTDNASPGARNTGVFRRSNPDGTRQPFDNGGLEVPDFTPGQHQYSASNAQSVSGAQAASADSVAKQGKALMKMKTTASGGGSQSPPPQNQSQSPSQPAQNKYMTNQMATAVGSGNTSGIYGGSGTASQGAFPGQYATPPQVGGPSAQGSAPPAGPSANPAQGKFPGMGLSPNLPGYIPSSPGGPPPIQRMTENPATAKSIPSSGWQNPGDGSSTSNVPDPESRNLLGLNPGTADVGPSGPYERDGTTWVPLPDGGELDLAHVASFAAHSGYSAEQVIQDLMAGNTDTLNGFYQYGQQYLWDQTYGLDAAIGMGVTASEGEDGTTFIDLPGIGQIDSQHAMQWAQSLGFPTIGDALASFGDVNAAYNAFTEYASDALFNPGGNFGTGDLLNGEFAGYGYGQPRGMEGTLQWSDAIQQAAAETGVPAALIAAVMGLESGGSPGAQSVAGAQGLMQVMPFWDGHFGYSIYDPIGNIMTGAYILMDGYQRYGDWATAVNSYLGFGAADAYGTTGETYKNIVADNLNWLQANGYA